MVCKKWHFGIDLGIYLDFFKYLWVALLELRNLLFCLVGLESGNKAWAFHFHFLNFRFFAQISWFYGWTIVVIFSPKITNIFDQILVIYTIMRRLNVFIFDDLIYWNAFRNLAPLVIFSPKKYISKDMCNFIANINFEQEVKKSKIKVTYSLVHTFQMIFCKFSFLFE